MGLPSDYKLSMCWDAGTGKVKADIKFLSACTDQFEAWLKTRGVKYKRGNPHHVASEGRGRYFYLYDDVRFIEEARISHLESKVAEADTRLTELKQELAKAMVGL